MEDRKYEPILPITNEELYEIVEGLSIRQLNDSFLAYLGHSNSQDIILTGIAGMPENRIYITFRESGAPITIQTNIRNSYNFDRSNCSSLKRNLSELLEMELIDVTCKEEVAV